MARYKLDTDNSGNDEILEGTTRAEVLQDVLSHHEIDELPEGWTLEEIQDEHAAKAKAGYVLGSDGKIYVQVKDDSQFGFAICDEELSWAGGVGSGLASWTLIPNDDSRITDEVRERLGWILDEQSSDMPPAATAPLAVQWEFMGATNQTKSDAAQAVATAMEIFGTTDTTKDVVAKACEILGNDWDAKSVLAMIENCSFCRVDEGAASDA